MRKKFRHYRGLHDGHGGNDQRSGDRRRSFGSFTKKNTKKKYFSLPQNSVGDSTAFISDEDLRDYFHYKGARVEQLKSSVKKKVFPRLSWQSQDSAWRIGWVQPAKSRRPGFEIGIFLSPHEFIHLACGDENGNLRSNFYLQEADTSEDIPFVSLVRHDATEKFLAPLTPLVPPYNPQGEPQQIDDLFADDFDSSSTGPPTSLFGDSFDDLFDDSYEGIYDDSSDLDDASDLSDPSDLSDTSSVPFDTSFGNRDVFTGKLAHPKEVSFKKAKQFSSLVGQRIGQHISRAKEELNRLQETTKESIGEKYGPQDGFLVHNSQFPIRLAHIKRRRRIDSLGEYAYSIKECRYRLPYWARENLSYRDLLTVAFFMLFFFPTFLGDELGYGLSFIVGNMQMGAFLSSAKYINTTIKNIPSSRGVVFPVERYFIRLMKECNILDSTSGLEGEHGKENVRLVWDLYSHMCELQVDENANIRQLLKARQIESTFNRFINVAIVLESNRQCNPQGITEENATEKSLALCDEKLLRNPSLMGYPTPVISESDSIGISPEAYAYYVDQVQKVPILKRPGINEYMDAAAVRADYVRAEVMSKENTAITLYQVSWPTSEWTYRQTLAQLFTHLQVPTRHLMRFRSNLEAGRVAIELSAVDPQLMPVTHYDHKLQRFVAYTQKERAALAADYTLRVGMMLCAFAFGVSPAVTTVQLQIDSLGLENAVKKANSDMIELATAIVRAIQNRHGVSGLTRSRGDAKDETFLPSGIPPLGENTASAISSAPLAAPHSSPNAASPSSSSTPKTQEEDDIQQSSSSSASSSLLHISDAEGINTADLLAPHTDNSQSTDDKNVKGDNKSESESPQSDGNKDNEAHKGDGITANPHEHSLKESANTDSEKENHKKDEGAENTESTENANNADSVDNADTASNTKSISGSTPSQAQLSIERYVLSADENGIHLSSADKENDEFSDIAELFADFLSPYNTQVSQDFTVVRKNVVPDNTSDHGNSSHHVSSLDDEKSTQGSGKNVDDKDKNGKDVSDEDRKKDGNSSISNEASVISSQTNKDQSLEAIDPHIKEIDDSSISQHISGHSKDGDNKNENDNEDRSMSSSANDTTNGNSADISSYRNENNTRNENNESNANDERKRNDERKEGKKKTPPFSSISVFSGNPLSMPNPVIEREVTVRFTSKDFNKGLKNNAYKNPRAFYRQYSQDGVLMTLPDGDGFHPCPSDAGLTDAAFAPFGSQDIPEMAERIFSEDIAAVLGASSSLDLSIQRADELAMVVSRCEQLSRSAQEGKLTRIEAAQEASELVKRINDPELNNVSLALLSALIDGKPMPSLQLRVAEHLQTVRQQAQHLIMEGNTDEGIEILTAELKKLDKLFEGDTLTIPRYFNSYAERVIYNRLFKLPKETTLLIPDDLFYAHFELGQLLSQVRGVEQGMEHLSKAVSYAPTYPLAHLQLSVQLAKIGDWEADRAVTLNALRVALDRDDAAYAYYRYAYTEWMRDEFALAAAAYIMSDAIAHERLAALEGELEELSQRARLQRIPIPQNLEEAMAVLEDAQVPVWPNTDIAQIVKTASRTAVNASLFIPARTLTIASARMKFHQAGSGMSEADMIFINSLSA